MPGTLPIAEERRRDALLELWDEAPGLPEREALLKAFKQDATVSPALADHFQGALQSLLKLKGEEAAKGEWRQTAHRRRAEAASLIKKRFRQHYGPTSGPMAEQSFQDAVLKIQREELHDWTLSPAQGVVYRIHDTLSIDGGQGLVLLAARVSGDEPWPATLVCKTTYHSHQSDEDLRWEYDAFSQLPQSPNDHPDIIKAFGLAPLRPPAGVRDSPRTGLLLEFLGDVPSLAEALGAGESDTTRRKVWMGRFLPVVRHLQELAGVIRHLHEHRRLAHGDLKPANLLLVDDRLKLIDLGISELVLRSRNSRGDVRGASEFYAAPEAMGNNAVLRLTSDIYSIGVIALELLSGQPASALAKVLASTPSPARLFELVLEQHPRPARHRLLLVRKPLESLFARTLARDPAARAAAGELVRLLGNLELAIERTLWPGVDYYGPALEGLAPVPRFLGGKPLTDYFTEVGDFQPQLDAAFDLDLHPDTRLPLRLVHGSGGHGKSTQTGAYATRHAAPDGPRRYEFILWTNAGNELLLRNDVQEALKQLGEPDADKLPDPIGTLLQRLKERPNWLWVWDGCPDDNLEQTSAAGWAVERFSRIRGCGHLLVSTRFSPPQLDLPPTAGLALGTMPEPVALDFLFHRAGRNQKTAPPTEQDAAKELVGPTATDGFPLALEFAGVKLRLYGGTIRDLLGDFKVEPVPTLDAGYNPQLHPHLKPLSKTFTPLFNYVRKQDPVAAALLTASAFLAPTGIPIEVFLTGTEWPDAALNDFLRRDVPEDTLRRSLEKKMRLLASYSLIPPISEQSTSAPHAAKFTHSFYHSVLGKVIHVQRDAPTTGKFSQPGFDWRMHSLVQKVVVESLALDAWTLWKQAVAQAVLGMVRQCGCTGPSALPIVRRWIASCRAVEPLWRSGLPGVSAVCLAEGHAWVGSYFDSMGAFGEAESQFRQALQMVESHSPDHPDLSTYLCHLGGLLGRMGCQSDAEQHLRRALAFAGKAHGPESPQAAKVLHNLSYFLLESNRLSEAESMSLQSLKLHTLHYGEDDLRLAPCISLRGRIFRINGRLCGAEAMFRRALVLTEWNLGPSHPDAVVRLSDLAGVMEDTKRLKRLHLAEPLLKRALAIAVMHFGEDHPTVGTCLNNLGTFLCTTNRPAEAADPLLLALAISEKALGPEHPVVAIYLNDLALLFKSSGRLEKARFVGQRALSILMRSTSPVHLHLDQVRATLKLIWGKEGLTPLEFEAWLADFSVEKAKAFSPMSNEFTDLLVTTRTATEILAVLEDNHRRDNRPSAWLLPLNEPIWMHIPNLVGEPDYANEPDSVG